MKKTLALITLLFNINIAAHAQVYEFTGSASYGGDSTLAAAFNNATTFSALLIFDISQTTSTAAHYSASPGSFEYANYNYSSITYQLGAQSWTHSGTYANSDEIQIQDGLANPNTDEALEVLGHTNQLLDNGYTVDYSLLYSYHHDFDLSPIFSGADASNLLAWNDLAAYNSWGRIYTDGGIVSLDSISMRAVEAIPEPATWLMMIIGFGMVGTFSRKRRRSTGQQGATALS